MANKTYELWHVYTGICSEPVRVIGRNVGNPDSRIDYIIVSGMDHDGGPVGKSAIYPILINYGKEWAVVPPECVEDADDVDRDGAVLPDIVSVKWCRDITAAYPVFPTPDTY